MEILSVSVAKGIYPASESNRDTNPGASLANYKVVHKGDVVYNSMRMWQGAVGSSDYDGIVSPAYVVARPVIELDSTCFGYLLKRPEMLYKYLCDSQGNSKDTQTLKYNRFADIEVTMPVNLEEQRVISACLGRVDTLITLHQRKYDKLCTVKKSMLDKMFPKPGETEPEIRFEGFTDPWEQRKLGEVAHRVIRKNEGNQSDLPLTISAQHGLVDQRDYFNNQVASRDMSGYYLLENGEFAYNKSTSGDSPWGAIKRLTKYEKGCLSTLYICFGLDLGDPDFLVTYYETNRWHGAVQMIAAEGARNHGLLNIAPDDFFETVLTLPCSTEEQKQIGCFFTQLNSLITLHQRKCQYRSLYGYLSWEQRKLGNCGTTYGGLSGKTKEDFGHGNARFVPYTNVFDNPLTDTKRLETVEIDSSQNKVAYGDTFFTVSSETPDEVGMSSVWLSDQDDVYLNSFCFGYRQDSTFDPHYLAYMLRSSSIRSDLTLLAQGISRFNISKNKVMELSVPVPSAAEQKQIGQYFARLDSLITLHQREPRFADTG